MNFIRFVAKNAGKLITAVNMIAGATSSIVVNKILNIIIPNIDIFLSIGGAISGILDYIFDKKLNNSIGVI